MSDPDIDEPPLVDHRPPHTVPADDLARRLQTDLQDGLSREDAALRLAREGGNVVKGDSGKSLWTILMNQVSNALTVVLVAVMGLSFGIDDVVEGGLIAFIIAANIVVGFWQDYRAEKKIQALCDLAAPTCKVMRDGQTEVLKAENIVVGDVVQLVTGDKVPADLRLVEGINMSTDEALLTGESVPISKNADAVLVSPDCPLGDRANMLFSATIVTRGRGKGLVTAVGMSTETGKIAAMMRSSDDGRREGEAPLAYCYRRTVAWIAWVLGLVGTPLEVTLGKCALLLFLFAMVLTFIVFAVNRFDADRETILYAICVGVAVIPESLVAVLTVTMAIAAGAMSKQRVIVRKMVALEAIGGVTNICSDKTGTLTQGRMITRKVWLREGVSAVVSETTDTNDPTSGSVSWHPSSPDPEKQEPPVHLPSWSSFLRAIALCNNSVVSGGKTIGAENESVSTERTPVEPQDVEWNASGEPTEIALQVFAMRYASGKPELMKQDAFVNEFPFDSGCKRMSVVYKRATGARELYAKGAVEAILPLLDEPDDLKATVTDKAEELAVGGLRVLCVAYRCISHEGDVSNREQAESRLHFLGLAGLYDPPRPETAGAVKQCQAAGIKVHMLTGDHVKTATSIAYEVGILPRGLSQETLERVVMPAGEFDNLSSAQVDEMETLPLVIGRCSPATKVKVVEAMIRRQAFCVMTGDGVNDAPALKNAEVGIAMGKRGSDVAKEAADLVLEDDNFASIVEAVKEGRRLFDNIQKFLMHLLISNISQVFLLLIGLSFKDASGVSSFPLSPFEILWANLVMSTPLAIGLGKERAQHDIMRREPHHRSRGIFTRELLVDKMVYGTAVGALCLAAFATVGYGGPGATGSGAGLGHDCNEGWNESCRTVYRARATAYATFSMLILVTAWEVKHFTRSLFSLRPELYRGPAAVFRALGENGVLLWGVGVGAAEVFAIIYIPYFNRVVCRHGPISWEWGIVFGAVVVYLACVEGWKALKRRFGWGSIKMVESDEMAVA